MALLENLKKRYKQSKEEAIRSKKDIGMEPTEESVKEGLEFKEKITKPVMDYLKSKEEDYPMLSKAGQKGVDVVGKAMYPETVEQAKEQQLSSMVPVAGTAKNIASVVGKDVAEQMARTEIGRMSYKQILGSLKELYGKYGKDVVDSIIGR